MELKGSRTEANLMTAFAGESQAAEKYWIYARKAMKDGYEQIGAIFNETSANERAHAKQWFKFLHEGIGETLSNLKDAAAGEHYEWTEMYAQFAREAKEEGFDIIAKTFELVASIEKEHEERFNKLNQNIKNNQVFQRGQSSTWVCRYCGYVHEATEAPEFCPVCKHAKAYFELKAENY